MLQLRAILSRGCLGRYEAMKLWGTSGSLDLGCLPKPVAQMRAPGAPWTCLEHPRLARSWSGAGMEVWETPAGPALGRPQPVGRREYEAFPAEALAHLRTRLVLLHGSQSRKGLWASWPLALTGSTPRAHKRGFRETSCQSQAAEGEAESVG